MAENEIAEKQEVNTDLSALQSPQQLLEFGKMVCNSKLSPMKTPADVVAAVLLGRDLGLGAMTALNNIYCVSGKASVNIHIITAKILQAGVTYEIVKDFEPVYQYRDKAGITYKEEFILSKLDKYQLITATTKTSDFIPTQTQILRSAIDTESVIRFQRQVKQKDGSFQTMTYVSRLTWSEITLMGLNEKDNWVKMPRLMLRTRNLTIGARFIASDTILGLYEHSELADVNNKPYIIDEDTNTVTIIDDSN